MSEDVKAHPMTDSEHRAGSGEHVNFAQAGFTLRHRLLNLRISRRVVYLCLAVFALILATCLLALVWGEATVKPGEVVQALLGSGTRRSHMVVVQWRLPRVLLALLIGAGLALSGAIFQSLTRNPLGSPDIIGFSTGAYTGALLSIIIGAGSYAYTALGSFVGGIATALVVYLLSYRRGVAGFRLIIVGIGVSTALAAVNTLLIIRADLDVALRATVWGAGTLAGANFELLGIVALICLALIPAALATAPTLRQIELGDDAARALGTRTQPQRLYLMFIGVALTALATAAVGPISFVALVAPHIARRLAKASGPALLPTALIGALLLLISDVLAQRLAPATPLPVGIMTVSLGGFYFIWLLVRESRKG
ncbi:FecCD family ABC transporter permease [Glutamicibacter sp. NPDC087344]|uniref:FecCD family ABC transporter permease n=1 Tax=Glutamicibacter sp. NPDC087344 TaxID=3363994 RepID=UPI003808559B